MREAEIDRMLLRLFRRWRSCVRESRDEDTHWLEEFCSWVWDKLEEFERDGRLKQLRP